MTNAERMFAAIRRQPIDRVPFATYNFHPFSAEHANDPSYAELLELVTARAGMLCKADGVARPAEPQQWGTIDVTTEDLPTQAITRQTLHTPKGDLTSVTVKPADQPALVTEHFIKTDADIDRYMSLPHVPAHYDVAPLARLSDKLAGRGLLYVGYDDAMYAAASLFDFNDFAIRCHTDIGAVKRFVDFHFERVRDNVRRLVTACRGLPALFYTAGPELCTPPMTSPAVFAALVTPYQRQLIEIIHDAGFAAAIHCHGRVRSILEEVLRTGADVLEPIEPPPQGDITLVELLQKVGDRLCLVGHIQDQEFHTVAPGTMTSRVEAIARLVNGRTGYVMTPTCTPFQHPASATFQHNYREWIEAADRVLA